MHKILTHEEEMDAWKRGDIDAVVESIMPIAERMVRRMAKGDVYLEDEMRSCAGEMIAIASKRFDPSQNNRFSTYALSHLRIRLWELRTEIFRKAMVHCESLDLLSHHKGHELAFDNAEIANHILDVVCCSERERSIVVARYKGYTLAEVGKMFDVSKQRIGTIERSFLNDARTYLQKKFAA